nr:unnamed protein product [Digitaria exilis]
MAIGPSCFNLAPASSSSSSIAARCCHHPLAPPSTVRAAAASPSRVARQDEVSRGLGFCWCPPPHVLHQLAKHIAPQGHRKLSTAQPDLADLVRVVDINLPRVECLLEDDEATIELRPRRGVRHPRPVSGLGRHGPYIVPGLGCFLGPSPVRDGTACWPRHDGPSGPTKKPKYTPMVIHGHTVASLLPLLHRRRSCRLRLLRCRYSFLLPCTTPRSFLPPASVAVLLPPPLLATAAEGLPPPLLATARQAPPLLATAAECLPPPRLDAAAGSPPAAVLARHVGPPSCRVLAWHGQKAGVPCVGGVHGTKVPSCRPVLCHAVSGWAAHMAIYIGWGRCLGVVCRAAGIQPDDEITEP